MRALGIVISTVILLSFETGISAINLSREATCQDFIGGYGLLQPLHDGLIEVTLQANQRYPQNFTGIQLMGMLSVFHVPELLQVLNLELTQNQIYLYAERRAKTHGRFNINDPGVRASLQEGEDQFIKINYVFNQSIAFKHRIVNVAKQLVAYQFKDDLVTHQRVLDYFDSIDSQGNGTDEALSKLYQFLTEANDEVLRPIRVFFDKVEDLLVADTVYAKNWKKRYSDAIQDWYYHRSLAKANGKPENEWPDIHVYTGELIKELRLRLADFVGVALLETFPNMPEDDRRDLALAIIR